MSRLWVLLAAAALDWLLGDPAWMPHPIRLMDGPSAALETGLRPLFPGRREENCWLAGCWC